jgi:hypothetical protein
MGWRFTVVGGCAFKRNAITSDHPCWTLQFLWLHPFSRHRGLWSESFPLFLQRYQLLHIVPLTTGMKSFLEGRPTKPVQGSGGEILRLFSQEPGCPRHPHKAMWQHWPGLWLCGAPLPDGSVCKETWAAPAAREPHAERTATR